MGGHWLRHALRKLEKRWEFRRQFPPYNCGCYIYSAHDLRILFYGVLLIHFGLHYVDRQCFSGSGLNKVETLLAGIRVMAVQLTLIDQMFSCHEVKKRG